MSDNEVARYEKPDSYEKRTLCCFVLDRSGSMDGKRIDSLNKAMQSFIQDMRTHPDYNKRIEVAIVNFDNHIEVQQKAELVEKIDDYVDLESGGTTKLVDAVRKGIEIVKDTKKYYNDYGLSYSRSFIFLITDGNPDSNQDVDGLELQLKEDTQKRRYVLITLGVGEPNVDYNENILQRITGYLEKGTYGGSLEKDENGNSIWVRQKPLKLKDENFDSIFRIIKKVSKDVSDLPGSNDGLNTGTLADGVADDIPGITPDEVEANIFW